MRTFSGSGAVGTVFGRPKEGSPSRPAASSACSAAAPRRNDSPQPAQRNSARHASRKDLLCALASFFVDITDTLGASRQFLGSASTDCRSLRTESTSGSLDRRLIRGRCAAPRISLKNWPSKDMGKSLLRRAFESVLELRSCRDRFGRPKEGSPSEPAAGSACAAAAPRQQDSPQPAQRNSARHASRTDLLFALASFFIAITDTLGASSKFLG